MNNQENFFYNRILDLKKTLKRKSLFLLGPRQTGKSSFLQKRFPDALYIDLLLNENYSTFLKAPELLRKKIVLYIESNQGRLIIIDEIQKLPELLNEIHYLIEKYKELRFILTGSSARKLRLQKVNLLGGRASYKTMYPLTFKELSAYGHVDLNNLLSTGAIASIITSSDKFEDLEDYIVMYLKEEIKLEG